eukprot:jgi/Ulvmu1/9606/UM054_0036.1
MDTEHVSFAMPGHLFPFEQPHQHSAAREGDEDSAASDYLIHSWEAPTAVSACCSGKFASANASCAFAQQGGVAFLDAHITGVFSAHDMHCFDRIDNAVSIRVPGMHRDMLCVRTRDMTFTFMATTSSTRMEQLHAMQLAPEAIVAGTGTRATAMSQPVILMSDFHEGRHQSVVYIALATTVAIYILDIRIEVSTDGVVAVTSHVHTAAMPHAAPSQSRDPDLYPDNPRSDSPAAITFVPSRGQYAPRGVATLAVLWARNTTGGLPQRDVDTVELVVGDPKATHKTAFSTGTGTTLTSEAVARGAAGIGILTRGADTCISRVDARVGPWTLFAVYPTTALLMPLLPGHLALALDSPDWNSCTPSGTGLPATARRGLPSCPELLMLSQEEAILLSISSETGCLRATCKLPLQSAPVACAPLGHGAFFILDASANAAVLTIAPAPAAARGPAAPALRHECTVTMRCRAAPYGADARHGAEPPADAAMHDHEESPQSGAPARDARHASAACALPCGQVPELQRFAALVIVGTLAGPACVIGVPREAIDMIDPAQRRAADHPASPIQCEEIVPRLTDAMGPIHDCLSVPAFPTAHSDALIMATGTPSPLR